MDIEQPHPHHQILSIQASSEFPFFMRNTELPQHRHRKDQLKTLTHFVQNYPEHKIKLNQQHLNNLIVELIYLLYSCKVHGRMTVIEPGNVKVEQSFTRNGERRMSVVIYYSLKSAEKEHEGILLLNVVIQYIFGEILKYSQARRSNEESLEGDQDVIFQKFIIQYKQLAYQIFTDRPQAISFKCLEQTDIFFQNSLLYRIKESSLTSLISSSRDVMSKFKEHKYRDETLTIQYNNEKKKNKNDHLKDKSEQIDNNIINFFKIIDPNLKKYTKEEHEASFRIKMAVKITQKLKYTFQSAVRQICGEPSEKSLYQGKRPLFEMDFQVKYCSERNSIVVKLFLPTNSVNVENSDFLTYQTNIITHQAMNISVNLQSQPSKAEKPKEEGRGMKAQNKPEKALQKKLVTFKGTSSFNVKQPVLQKILLLMDMTMIAARVYQSQVTPGKYSSGNEGPLRIFNLSERVSHYTKFCMRCAKRVYSHG